MANSAGDSVAMLHSPPPKQRFKDCPRAVAVARAVDSAAACRIQQCVPLPPNIRVTAAGASRFSLPATVTMSFERSHWLWRQAQLQMPQKRPRKQGATVPNENTCELITQK